MIVVFGSINADLVSSVAHHPKAGETVFGCDYLVLPGGKGANQALAACKSGAHTKLVGAVGSDGFASQALANLKAEGVDLNFVHHTDGTTGTALIIIDAMGENTIVVTPGANATVKASQIGEQDFSLLITQNELVADEVWKAHQLARQCGALVVHNAAPAAAIPTAALSNIDYLIVNETEAILVARSLGFVNGGPMEAARYIQATSYRSVVVTLGSRGAFATNGTEEFEAPSLPVDVKDTTGAGDAFVGAFAAALDQGNGFEGALRHGTIAGSLACRSTGAQSSIPNASEIASHINR